MVSAVQPEESGTSPNPYFQLSVRQVSIEEATKATHVEDLKPDGLLHVGVSFPHFLVNLTQ